jgi:hypothetical protein
MAMLYYSLLYRSAFHAIIKFHNYTNYIEIVIPFKLWQIFVGKTLVKSLTNKKETNIQMKSVFSENSYIQT